MSKSVYTSEIFFNVSLLVESEYWATEPFGSPTDASKALTLSPFDKIKALTLSLNWLTSCFAIDNLLNR